MKIFYVTNNEKKLKELKEILKKTIDITTIDSIFDLDYNLKEFKTDTDLKNDALNKVRAVWRREKKNYDYIISDSFGLFCEYAPEILGVNLETWWPGTDRDRNEALLRLFDGVKEREVYYNSVFIAMDSQGKMIGAEGYTYGFLGKRVKERNGSGYDSIIILESGRYLSHHSNDDIQKINARTIAMEQLANKIKPID